MARKLRIAVSVFFGLLTVAMCVLWVRSFWRTDLLIRWDTPLAVVSSNSGHMAWNRISTRSRPRRVQWTYSSAPADRRFQDKLLVVWGLNTKFAASHLSIALLLAAIAFMPWAVTRFSLRTLLIATTLLAVVLGLGVWLAR